MVHSSDGRSLMSFVITTRARGSIGTSKRGVGGRDECQGFPRLGVLRSIKVLPKISQGWVLKNDEI
jgi:hypothetical protein